MTICPEEIRRDNRRAKHQKFRRTARYRRRVKELTEGKPCIICGATERLTIHHTAEDDYHDEETYFRALEKGVVMCNRHHHAWHKGKTKRCPDCGKELIAPEYDCCWNCIPDDVKSARKNTKKYWNDLRNQWNRENYQRMKERMRV